MNLPGFDQFVLPYGRGTNPQYSSSAANAWATLLGGLAQADAYQKTGLATADANKYGAYSGGIGQAYGGYTSGLANLYGTLGSLASNGAASSANAYGALSGGLSNLGQSRAAAAAAEDNAYTGLAVGLGGANADAYGAYSSALQGLAGAQSNENVGLANSYAGMQTGLANSVANTYGNYAGGLGNIAQSMAAERAANYNSNAMAEAARQASVGNIGSAALGAYGSAAGTALNSWGQAEAAYQNARGNIGSAYMNSMGGLGTANQAAISNIGSTRNQALGSLGQSYANASQGLAAASAVGDLDLSFQDYGTAGSSGAGGEFSAAGPNGLIASGSYGGDIVPGSGGMSLTASRSADNSKLDGVISGTFGGLENTASQLDNQEAYGQLADGLGASYGALGSGFASAVEGMRPDYGFLTNTLGTVGGEIRSLAGQGYSEAGSGMDQYYANQPQSTDYTPLMGLMERGYNDASSKVGQYGSDAGAFQPSEYSGYAGQLSSGFADTRGDLSNLAGRGFDSIADGQYSDTDLLGGLLGGYGASLGNINQLTALGASQFADSANALGVGLTNANQLLSAGYTPPSNQDSGSLASDMWNSLDDSGRSDSTPYIDALRREYTQLIRAGGTERFNPYSGSYDQAAAQRKAWLEGQLKGGQPRGAYA